MEKINILKKICPVCYTDEFIVYDMGSHASGYDGETGFENYECNKCGGEFFVQYEIKKDKVLYMKINYKGERTNRNSVLTRA